MVSKLTAFAALAVWLLPCGRVAIAQAPTGWSSFRSPDYGFTIAYAPTMKLYDHPRGEDPGGYAAICQATVACFGYPGDEFKGTTFDGAGIAINILRDAKTEQQCSTLGSAEYPQPTTRTETHPRHPFSRRRDRRRWYESFPGHHCLSHHASERLLRNRSSDQFLQHQC